MKPIISVAMLDSMLALSRSNISVVRLGQHTIRTMEAPD
jgi:hypothetical protein